MNRYFLTATFLITSINLFPFGKTGQRIEILEEKMKEARTETVYGNYGAKTASGYPNLNSCGLYLWCDALIYQYFTGGSDYVFTNRDTTGATFKGTLKDLDFGWRWGFKAGLGLAIGSNGYQLWSEYTRFKTDQSKEETSLSTVLNQNFQNTQNGYDHASLRWKLSYNTLDLDAGRAYFLRRHFSVFPRFGVRGTSVLQRMHGNAARGATILGSRAKNDFRGIGILAGTQFRWNLTSQWSFYGDVGGSLNWGKLDISLRTNEGVLLIDNDADLYRIIPNASFSSGLRWEYPLISNRTRISFAASYEFLYWWRMNQMIHQVSTTNTLFKRNSEDLGLHGVNLSGAFDF